MGEGLQKKTGNDFTGRFRSAVRDTRGLDDGGTFHLIPKYQNHAFGFTIKSHIYFPHPSIQKYVSFKHMVVMKHIEIVLYMH